MEGWRDKERGRQGDMETGGHGDKEKRRQGEREAASPSPCLLVPPLPVSPALRPHLVDGVGMVR
jgi:hypothetical protein